MCWGRLLYLQCCVRWSHFRWVLVSMRCEYTAPWSAQIVSLNLFYGLSGCALVIKDLIRSSHQIYSDSGTLYELDNVNSVNQLCDLQDGPYNSQSTCGQTIAAWTIYWPLATGPISCHLLESEVSSSVCTLCQLPLAPQDQHASTARAKASAITVCHPILTVSYPRNKSYVNDYNHTNHLQQ